MAIKKQKVLAVDDVTMNLLIIKETLSKDVEVYVAKSANNALVMLNMLEVDLFLVDLNMPGVSGFEFIQKLRLIERYKETPIIIVTANDKVDTVKFAVELGVKEYVVKPFNQYILRNKVLEALKTTVK